MLSPLRCRQRLHPAAPPTWRQPALTQHGEHHKRRLSHVCWELIRVPASLLCGVHGELHRSRSLQCPASMCAATVRGRRRAGVTGSSCLAAWTAGLHAAHTLSVKAPFSATCDNSAAPGWKPRPLANVLQYCNAPQQGCGTHLGIPRVGIDASQQAQHGRRLQLVMAAVPRQCSMVALNVELRWGQRSTLCSECCAVRQALLGLKTSGRSSV